jgi:hypothetical protein
MMLVTRCHFRSISCFAHFTQFLFSLKFIADKLTSEAFLFPAITKPMNEEMDDLKFSDSNYRGWLIVFQLGEERKK